MKTIGEVYLTPSVCVLNGATLPTTAQGDGLLKELYRSLSTDYPKFFKMDGLCRLGFMASEVLLRDMDEQRFVPREDRAVILVSRSGCLATDLHYQQTIQPRDAYFPSPALFVYTLPNIVTGEIAIRNQYRGETSMYLVAAKDDEVTEALAAEAFLDATTTSAIAGWVDYRDGNDYEAHLKLYTI